MRCGIAAGIALLALGVSPLFAQQSLRFTSPADVTIGRDYGFLAHDQKLTDTILVVRLPQLSFVVPFPCAKTRANRYGSAWP